MNDAAPKLPLSLIEPVRYLAMTSGTFQKLSGTVETDETYIGGLLKNVRVAKRVNMIGMPGGKGEVAIEGAAERSGQVVAAATHTISGKEVHASIRNWVETGAALFTNGAYHYSGLGST